MYKRVLLGLIAVVVLLSGGCRLLDPILGNGGRRADTELIGTLRDYFGISRSEATDLELRDYLQDRDERRFAEAVVKQYEYGLDVADFMMNRSPAARAAEIEGAFYTHMATGGVLTAVTAIATASNLVVVVGIVTALDVLLSIDKGASIVRDFASIVGYSYVQWHIHDNYFGQRRLGYNARGAYDDTVGVYSHEVERVINALARLNDWSDANRHAYFRSFLEVRYQAHLVATNATAQEEIKNHILGKIPSAPPAGSFEGYALTRERYAETDDLDAAVRSEFGAGARVADWQDIKSQFSGRAREFAEGIGLAISPGRQDDGMFVYNRGSGFYNCPRWDGRHYYVCRFDGNVPGHYQVHDHMNGRTLCLGSWFNKKLPILVKLP